MGLTPNIDAFRNEVTRTQAAAANGPMKAQYEALGREIDAATSGINAFRNGVAIAKFESNLGSNAQFKRNLISLADNPDVVRRIMPQILDNPDNMTRIVAQAAAASAPRRPAAETPQAQASESPPPRQASTAPRVNSQAEKPPSPAATAAAPVADNTPDTPPPAPAATADAPPAAPAANDLSGKMAELAAIDGYDDLLDKIEANPRLNDMFGAMMSGSGDPKAAETTIDGILSQARENPRIFRDLIKTIDEKPGVVSSIAENMANDPQTGMSMLGMYSGFHNSAIGSQLGSFGPVLDGLIESLMGMLGKLFGGSGGLMSMSNSGGVLGQLMQTLTGNTAPVTAIDPETGAASDPQAAKTPAQIAQEREERLRQQGELNQRPGTTPTSPAAPAPPPVG